MLKSLARMAGFLAYLSITLEMLFMVTPFALYYYAAYAPFLSASSNLRALAWLPAFFLPHLSTEIVPSVGGLIFLGGLVGFLLGALQVYYSKFRQRGVVKRGFYKKVRHPQYLFLAVSGLGLLMVWPRFIVLIIYVHVLWFYYLLARGEEERMQSSYGDLYREPMKKTSMFIPGEPGRHLVQLLFGWISGRRLRLLVTYCASLVAAIGMAFGLRQLSLRLTTHLDLPDEKMAAVSFISSNEAQLRGLIQSVRNEPEVQDRRTREGGWFLVLATEGKRSVMHVMIDAGMTRAGAKNLPLVEKGIKLVFLRRRNQDANEDPFEAGVRWQPAFIVEMADSRLSRVLDLHEKVFRANPIMPIF